MDKLNLYLENGGKVWFTSDPHFGHANIIKFCERPFGSINDMDVALIRNWNDCVTDDDVVFMLGDFCWKHTPGNLMKILKQLNGKHIYIIPGNHDKPEAFGDIDGPWEELSRFSVLADMVHVYVRCKEGDKNPLELILSHYPLMTWSGRDRGCINLHGHVHSRPNDRGYDANLRYWDNQLDVGVDARDYRPVSLEEVLNILENKKGS